MRGNPPILPPGCEIPVAAQGFRYLGIFITPDPNLFYQRNLQPPLHRFQADAAHWQTLPISLLGRAGLYKMITLPRFIYILQNTPYKIHDSYFHRINGVLRTLLWNGGNPRIALSKLKRGWYDGGIVLPDIQSYYWAAQLITINKWAFLPLRGTGVALG